MGPAYFVGLDLGQTTDPTALIVLERSPLQDAAKRPEPRYAVPHLQRFPLGTSYTDIVAAVAGLVATAPLRGNATLVVDQTGVGRAVVDLLRQTPLSGGLVPVTITTGHTVTLTEDRSYHVPKKDLVSVLQLLLQKRRLQVARVLPEAAMLVKELSNFRVKITAAANETFGAWREGLHDDLVLAVALACWYAERQARRSGPMHGGGRRAAWPVGAFGTWEQES